MESMDVKSDLQKTPLKRNIGQWSQQTHGGKTYCSNMLEKIIPFAKETNLYFRSTNLKGSNLPNSSGSTDSDWRNPMVPIFL